MEKAAKYISLGLIGIVFLAVIASVPQFRRFLTTQVVYDIGEERTVKITIPEDAPEGEQTFSINVEDSEMGDLLAVSEPITVVVQHPATGAWDGGDEGESGGGGGGGESGGGDTGLGAGNAPSTPARTYAFAPEKGHQLSGKSSEVITDSGKVVVKLGDNESLLEKKVKLPESDYWLYVEAKHASPTPIEVAVYVNGKAWKILSLNKGDNKYRVERVGLLRGFKGGNISFRLVNGGANSRVFLVDSWALSTDPNLKSIKPTGATGAIKGTRTSGLHLLPRLNQITREELGNQFVKWDIWSYYAPRLVAIPARREAIGSEARLREVMSFWKLVQPQSPRGE